jgi:P_ylase: glycogen/starch/alpha-glucan phosphorylases
MDYKGELAYKDRYHISCKLWRIHSTVKTLRYRRSWIQQPYNKASLIRHRVSWWVNRRRHNWFRQGWYQEEPYIILISWWFRW